MVRGMLRPWQPPGHSPCASPSPQHARHPPCRLGRRCHSPPPRSTQIFPLGPASHAGDRHSVKSHRQKIHSTVYRLARLDLGPTRRPSLVDWSHLQLGQVNPRVVASRHRPRPAQTKLICRDNTGPIERAPLISADSVPPAERAKSAHCTA